VTARRSRCGTVALLDEGLGAHDLPVPLTVGAWRPGGASASRRRRVRAFVPYSLTEHASAAAARDTTERQHCTAAISVVVTARSDDRDIMITRSPNPTRIPQTSDFAST
jgi:hypothetical protein